MYSQFNIYKSPEFHGLSSRAKTVLDGIGFQTKKSVINALSEGGKLDLHTWFKWRRLGILTYNEIRTWVGMSPLPTKKVARTTIVHCPQCHTEIVVK